MSYLELNSIFLSVVAVVGVWALIVARRRGGYSAASIYFGLLVVLVMTAVFDNVMIGVGLVGYDREHISGVFLGLAPIEDFAYAVAAALLLPSLWVLLSPRKVGRERGRPRAPETAEPSEPQ